jgi:hypothetical protein
MVGSAACFAFHLGAPVPGSAGTWISLPIDAQVTTRYAHVVRSRLAQGCPSRANPCEACLAPHTAAKPRVILWRHFSQRIYRRQRS